MQTQPPATLPSRGTMDHETSLAHLTPRHKVGMATLLLVAAVLVIAIDLAVPKPNVLIQGATYAAPGCTGGATSQVVTATFRLVNRGPADGPVVVGLLVDRNNVASAEYIVPAGGSLPGQIQAILPDCAGHQFGLYLRYESYGSG